MRHSFCLTTLLCAAAAPVLAATVQVQMQDGAGKALPDAVVYLESKDAQAAVKPLIGAEVAQANKQFDPQVRVVTVGTAVQFPNHDTVRHQVYSFSDTKKFELKLYAGTTAAPVVFDKPGIAVLGCNIHDNMVAWIIVVPTPYFGRSGPDGKVSLDNLPPGNYRLRTWHTHLPVGTLALDQALNVPATGATVAVRMAGLAP
ncbi:methylamine utilization protein [Rhodoferax sp.]|uniref:methylamine utilization protein n=1 Tax=Rhodoferax sp. TaxID=50421 RepID=UPI0025DFBA6E|nr:methylamine utilization protein [Rhodoferax sp.]